LGNEPVVEGGKDAIAEFVARFAKSGVGHTGRRIKNGKQVINFALVGAFVLIEEVADDGRKRELAVAGKGGFGAAMCAYEAGFVQAVKEGR
jgi:hypothetical protein